MARFQVPQFIEIESKIFGPLTIKQFAYLAVGGGILVLLYMVFPFALFVVASIPISALALALAFYKINNQPFIKIIESAIKHYTTTRLYLWKKEKAKTRTTIGVGAQKTNVDTAQPHASYAPKFTGSKLRDLAWSLDVRSGNR